MERRLEYRGPSMPGSNAPGRPGGAESPAAVTGNRDRRRPVVCRVPPFGRTLAVGSGEGRFSVARSVARRQRKSKKPIAAGALLAVQIVGCLLLAGLLLGVLLLLA